MASAAVINSHSSKSVDGQWWCSIENICSNSKRKSIGKTTTSGVCLLSASCSVKWPSAGVSRDFGALFSLFNFYSHPAKLVLVLLITAGFVDCIRADNHQQLFNKDNFSKHPLNEFSSHTIIRPQIYHGRHKRAITTTQEEEGVHASHIILSYEHEGRSVVADLQLNEQLIPQGHFLRYHNSTGKSVIRNLTKTDVDLCHYQGTIRGNLDSRVAVSTCDGINGVVFDGGDTYFLYSGGDGQLHSEHYLFRSDDMIRNATCGYNGNSNDIGSQYEQHHISDFNRILRYKRSTTNSNVIRGPYNANKHSSFVELVIVVDNKVYKSFGENMKKVHNHCKDIANIVNALYVPLNIFIALVGVVVWNDANEIELTSDGDLTLKNFLQYRRKELVKNHPNDNAQLLTKEQFDGGVVGKALKGPMCTFEYSGGVSMEHSQIVGIVATTVAHEMGHNFGMEHDDLDCKCVDEKCIMSASSTSVIPRHWSSCSIDQLNVAFSRGMNYCLRNKPKKLFESPQCGNGFVEVGEQCDCGLPNICENTCCDPNTCMLRANASCATGECCDLLTCHPKTAGTECRSTEGECDLPEFCTGESEYCPTDVFKRDTDECDSGNAFCHQGTCRSRSSQCKILWGPSGESSDHCYEKNTEGSRHGNCGFDRLTNQYLQCAEEDVHCGMLHCRHLNERLEFGMESVAVLSHSFMSHGGSIIPCRTAIVDLGLQATDPGLTPNGARCGEGRMCLNQKCVALGTLWEKGQGVECPENCNGNGICNSQGNCHCFIGFAPPYCSSPGPGGSEDSGPATNPNGRVGFTRAMYIFFLGVVPAVSLFLFFTYYWKQNRPLATRKSPSVLKSVIKSNQSRGPPSPPPGLPTSTPSSTDDMNSALLKSPVDDSSMLNNTMFGKFKGFTLRPLPNAAGATNLGAPNVAFVHPVAKPPEENVQPNGIALRSAPPVPKPSNVVEKNQIDVKSIKQNGSLPTEKKSSPVVGWNLESINSTSKAPALPPPNPGFNARPIISSPVLEASTCTAKELLSPMKNPNPNSGGSVPNRPAPIIPLIPSDQKSNVINISDRRQKDGTIKRIASFLKKEEPTQQKYPTKVKPVIDREKLKNIEISAPIPVIDQTSDLELLDDHQGVSRTQSMRDAGTTVKKPNIQSFGSMRQPSNRPKSIVGSRPKSPPPRPPAPPIVKNLKLSNISNYQVPPEPRRVEQFQNEYDDCEAVEAPLAHISEENSPTGSDNIYSVIDETPSNNTLCPPNLNIISGSNDSMGLLGEIVNEIEKRNGDSIYSASTLKRKKSESNGGPYTNASEIGDYTEGDYVKSNSSTTSSGYLRPSAINTPIARVAPTRTDLAPTTTATSPSLTNNTTTTTSAFSSFKPKITSQLNSKSEPKPPVNVSARSSSPSNRRNGFSRTTTSSNFNGANKIITSDSVRKRSPSPSGVGTKLTGSGVGKNKVFSNSKISSGTSDSKKSSNNLDLTKKQPAGNLSQKPKPFSKPAVGSKPSPSVSTPITSGSNSESKFGRQNLLSDNNKPLLGSNSSAAKRTKSTESAMTNPKSSSSNNNSLSNNTNSSTSKILNAAARSTAGKPSNVASLQQKFESASKTPAGSSSYTGNSQSTTKK